MEEGCEPLVDLAFELDDAEANRDELWQASDGIIDDAAIRLLRRENRVGIARGIPTPVDSPAVPPGR